MRFYPYEFNTLIGIGNYCEKCLKMLEIHQRYAHIKIQNADENGKESRLFDYYENNKKHVRDHIRIASIRNGILYL